MIFTSTILNVVIGMKRLWAALIASVLLACAGCEAPEGYTPDASATPTASAGQNEVYIPQVGSVSVTADGVTITPKANYLHSSEWTKYGWLAADGRSLFHDSRHVDLKEMEQNPMILEFSDVITVDINGKGRAVSYDVYDLSYRALALNARLDDTVIRDLPDTAELFYISLSALWTAETKIPGAEYANSTGYEYVFLARRKSK